MASHLRANKAEVEQAILARAHAIADPTAIPDPDYAVGLRAAVSAVVEQAICTVEHGGRRIRIVVPDEVLAQARSAARNGVGIETVLRRCMAAQSVIEDYLLAAAQSCGAGGMTAVPGIHRSLATLSEQIANRAGDEHDQELARHRPRTSEEERAERVRRLLKGESVDVSDFAYDLNGHHLGVVATGPRAPEALKVLVAALDLLTLVVHVDEGVVWAWFGGRRSADPQELQRIARSSPPRQASLAMGEPGEGLSGWRLTHRQALAALAIAVRRSQPITSYADNTLLAAMLKDDLLATSLCERYLAPLEQYRDEGQAARETLRAYVAADHHTASTASALGVSRRTVNSRLRRIEADIGHPIARAGMELSAALQFRELKT